MKDFVIERLDDEFTSALQKKVNDKTKPPGSLGKLEDLAIHIGRIQRSLEPQLQAPELLVFAADHGIAQSGVSAYPSEVTEQMVLNFLRGGAAINVFCQLNNIRLRVIDAGVNAQLPAHPNLLNAKIAKGTRNILEHPAMTLSQCQQAIKVGAEQAQAASHRGSNVLALGEMGIGNTSSAALLVHMLTSLPLETCVGRGTGLDAAGLSTKLNLLREAVARHSVSTAEPLQVLTTFGGFEIAMMCGAFLQAAQNRMVILVDGFIASAAVLVASCINPAVLDYCIFTHCSDEQGHKPLLEWLEASPLMNLGMRLGEGSGAAVAYPLVQAAVHFLQHMASFEEAGVSRGG